jgi:hypothetical protein
MIFAPQADGSATIRSSPAAFLDAFRRRVAGGLLTGHPHPRSNYVVIESGPASLRVRAADWWTAMNVGLNDVELQVAQPSSIRYRVRYWRWAAYALGLSAILGLIGLVLLVTLDARGYIARNMDSMIPGLSVDQNLMIAWAMVVFWGFVWPWLLIALHKQPVRRLMARVVGEVDAQAVGAHY